jgi:hypothetical protein
VDDKPLRGHLSNRTVSTTRAFSKVRHSRSVLESKRRSVFFFLNPPNLICRLGISVARVEPRDERAVHFFCGVAEKTDRVNPETSVSRDFPKLASVLIFAYGLSVCDGPKFATRFRNFPRTPKRVSRTSPPASYSVKTSASDALRDAHARSFSTLAMSGSVTRAPALACDRAELQTGIVHFGVGGFHRSHQQVRLPFVEKAC